jgi:hypothetical protein
MKIVPSIIFSLCIIACCLSSCNNAGQLSNKKETAAIDNPKLLTTLQEELSGYNDDAFAENPSLKDKVLTTGMFHADEVDEDDKNKSWMGLFKGKDGYYLSSTKIKTEKVHDPIVDKNETIKTGWEVSTGNPDVCLILTASQSFLTDRKVEAINVPEEIQAGKSATFTCGGKEYKLFSMISKKEEGGITNWSGYLDYRLYVSTIIDGQEVAELLIAQQSFDDQSIKILFTGDIDGDNKPDFIIDTSNHYNVTSPTLYLSAPAEKGHLVKPFGIHRTVGC